MDVFKTREEYLRYCNFNGELADELNKRYPPIHPWLSQKAVQHSAIEQHFTVNFRNFDGSRHLTVGVKRIDGAYRYTFSER